MNLNFDMRGKKLRDSRRKFIINQNFEKLLF